MTINLIGLFKYYIVLSTALFFNKKLALTFIFIVIMRLSKIYVLKYCIFLIIK